MARPAPDTSDGLNAAAQDPHVPLRHVLAFLAMVFGMFMAILDIQIVSASLSEIQAGLSASADEITWVQTSYLIAEVVMIPLSGILGRIFSTRYFFAASAAGFTLMSIMCAFSSSISEMIVWRALQGFIGGGMIPSVFAAAYSIFPKSKQPFVAPLVGLVATLAPTIGPTVGGYLTDLFSWHWLFLVNVAPGILVAISTYALIDFDKPDLSLLENFDWIGLGAMALFLGNLEYVLEEGPSNDWFEDETIFICALLSGAGSALFFWRSLKSRQPVVDLRAFEDRTFTMGCAVSLVLGIGLYGLTYLYPVYLANIRSYSALQIGTTMFVTGITMFICAPITGKLMTRVDPRMLIAFGLCIFSFSVFMLAKLTKDWDFYELLAPQILRGAGLMFVMVPINNVTLSSLPPLRLKGASGLFNLMRNLGGAFGLAGINTMMNKRLDLHLARLQEQVRWGNPVAEETLDNLTRKFADFGSDAQLVAMKTLNGMVRREAMVMSLADVFLALALLFAALLLVTPWIKPPPDAAAKPPVEGGH